MKRASDDVDHDRVVRSRNALSSEACADPLFNGLCAKFSSHKNGQENGVANGHTNGHFNGHRNSAPCLTNASGINSRSLAETRGHGPCAGGSSSSTSKGKCDKCDGPHETGACPHFRRTRENHKDAWVNYGRKSPLALGQASCKKIVQGAHVVPQPGDGSCLFHSLCYGLQRCGSRLNAQQLRRELANFISRNPRLEISGDTLEEWIKWDAESSVRAYTSRMAVSGWGGGIEMAVCAILHKANVHVYEASRSRGAYERISCFECPEPTQRTINVLYKGGMHFDAILV